MRFTTTIPATNKRLHILGSVIGQMSDGIWENTRSMEKYWKNLSYGKDASGNIYLEDNYGVCADVYDFFANKIKQIIKIEIDDGRNSGLRWDRMCSVVPDYIDGIVGYNVTAGDCYELYELLKGRNTSKYRYATYSDYTVELSYGNMKVSFVVSALNETTAKQKAFKKFTESCAASVVKA